VATWNYGLDSIRSYSDLIDGLIEFPIDPIISILDPLSVPMASGLMSPKLPKSSHSSWKVEFYEDRLQPWIYTFGAAATASATTLNIVNSSTMFQAGQKLFIPSTREQVLCQVAPSADDGTGSTYERGTGGSPMAAIANGAIAVDMGMAGKEFGEAPEARRTTPQARTFWAQWLDGYVVESSWMAHTQAEKTSKIDRAYQQMKQMAKYKLDIEHNIFFSFGSSNLTAAASTLRPGMSGILQEIMNHGGTVRQMQTFTIADLEDFLISMQRYHKGSWSMYCGPLVKRAMNNWPRSYFEISQSEKFFGNDIQTIVTAFGNVSIFNEPWWTEPGMAGMAFFIPNPVNEYIELWTVSNPDPSNHRFKSGEATWYFDVDTNNRVQTTKDSLLAAKGAKIKNAPKMGFMYDIVA
jgi:hypothetical protein